MQAAGIYLLIQEERERERERLVVISFYKSVVNLYSCDVRAFVDYDEFRSIVAGL